MNKNTNDKTKENAKIPQYPEKITLSCTLAKEMHPFMKTLSDGISEFSFPSLFLHRKKYNYSLSKVSDELYLLFGEQNKKSFFSVLGNFIDANQAEAESLFIKLLENGLYWKNMSESQKNALSPDFLSRIEEKYTLIDDRDNADYIYLREDLAQLVGKTYHKKRNLINAFEQSYTPRVEPLSEDNLADAFHILEEWKNNTSETFTDYEQCVEALNSLKLDNIKSCMAFEGIIVYADDKPAAWTLGEKIAQDRSFVVHFEKAITTYKGAYQYVTRAMARHLDESLTHMNREQDLGDEGLRQAKMTWRPSGFIHKYKIIRQD